MRFFLKIYFLIFYLIISVTKNFAQNVPKSNPVSTYSIVAYDERTGQFGVAVQSHWFSVGALVPWARAGVGAVATQSFVKVEYGPDGIALMESGKSAKEALNQLISKDSRKAVRQVAMIDNKGSVAAHIGENCIYAAGHKTGKNYSVQANLMEKETVWDAMAKAFENAEGDLATRMMTSLEAAENEGGDIRGKQSAAMLIVTGQPTGLPWEDIVMDIRVDDSRHPLKELKRLIRIHTAYQHANRGDHYLEINEVKKALKEYDLASELYPENPELPYWSAVTLVGLGKLDKALPIFSKVFKKEPRLRIMTPRIVDAGLLPKDEYILKLIMEVD
ncbi:MAG: Zn-dependent protease [Candidatus Marinimicrobia bacterium]|nr:Zn-dependent protease [Candidatus Neomarinimicrobiota bacterium]